MCKQTLKFLKTVCKRSAASPLEKSPKKFIMSSLELVSNPQKEGTRIIIDAIGINDELYYGNLSEPELVFIWEKIFMRSMDEVFGMTQKRSIKRNFRATFTLTHKISASNIYPRENFVFRRRHIDAKSEDDYDSIHCTIVGFNTPLPAEIGTVTRITATTCDFTVDPKTEILPWLACFGAVGTKYDYVRNSVGVRTDVIETEIRLAKHIPEYLPIAGRKIQISYPGIPRMCIKCFGEGHLKRNCRNKKMDWIDKVAEFRATGQYTDAMFGKWISILDQARN